MDPPLRDSYQWQAHDRSKCYNNVTGDIIRGRFL